MAHKVAELLLSFKKHTIKYSFNTGSKNGEIYIVMCNVNMHVILATISVCGADFSLTNSPNDITPTAWIAFHFANTQAFSVGRLEKYIHNQLSEKENMTVHANSSILIHTFESLELMLWWLQWWGWQASAPLTGRTPGNTRGCFTDSFEITTPHWQLCNNQPYLPELLYVSIKRQR